MITSYLETVNHQLPNIGSIMFLQDLKVSTFYPSVVVCEHRAYITAFNILDGRHVEQEVVVSEFELAVWNILDLVTDRLREGIRKIGHCEGPWGAD